MTAQEHGFKAEVQQLLDLMVHSVYSDRDVFLRELVSNAADALDKARFLSLTRDDLVKAGSGEEGIRILVDAEAGTIVIEDDGIGLTRDEAIENLGTIAHSGSRGFLERLKASGEGAEAPELIGRFGVGFYSCFMVATEVIVESRSALPDERGVRWISRGTGTYTVEDSLRDERGTRITLNLRDDAMEYADEARIGDIVRTHSNFLSWPIRVGEEQANSGKALWVEPPSSVTDEEANGFYRSIAMDWQDPAMRIHVRIDSPIQYSAMLFVPSNRPYDLFYPDAAKGPRLYARRVLIADHAKDLLPDWLRFLKGVVDSEDISLNVSREMIQKTPVVRKIRDALTKKVLNELERAARRSEEPAEDEEPTVDYAAIWEAFGVLLKEGYYHDKDSYGEKLLPLLRFNTLASESEDQDTSLARYRANMPEGQDTIWYLTAESRETALLSPHLEAFRKRGWDVLLLTDTVDEWLMHSLTEYDGIQVKSVARGELELEDEPGEETEKADLTGLGPWLEGVLGGAVRSVRPSTRLTDSPCVLVDEDAGVSANMERILRSANQEVAASRRTLELNVKHPLIRDMAALHEQGRSEVVEPLARLLLDDALLLEGTVRDAPAVGRRLQDLLQRAASDALRSTSP